MKSTIKRVLCGAIVCGLVVVLAGLAPSRLAPEPAGTRKAPADEAAPSVPIEEFVSFSGRGLMWDEGQEEVFYGHTGPGDAFMRISQGAKSRLGRALSAMHEDRVGMTRLFLLYDMRNLELTKPLPQQLYEDLDGALREADQHGISLVLTLYDFYLAREHPEVFRTPRLQKAMTERAVEVVEYLNRHQSRARVKMIDICNEPDSSDWITHGGVKTDDWKPVFEPMIVALHRATDIPLTVGFNARANSLQYAGKLSDNDFLCWHYYHNKPAVFDVSVPELRKRHPDMGKKRVLLEEYGALDPRDQEHALTQAYQLGFCGILFWKGIWDEGIVIFDRGAYRRWVETHLPR